MLQLFRTLFDIVRLAKGPDAIPHSRVLFALIVILWLGSGLVMTVVVPELDARSFVIGALIGLIGLSCYAAIIVLSGRRARLLQAVMALLGCGALMSLVFIALHTLLPLLSSEATAGIVTSLALLWLVPVEGHIIARTIERHWYVGIIIAISVFVLQLSLYSALDPTPMATA